MPDDEKKPIGVETVGERENQGILSEHQETPERKAEREFRENKERVLLRLEDYLAAIKVKEGLDTGLERALEQDISIEIPPARTLQSMKEEMMAKGHTLKDLHKEVKKLALRLQGVKNIKDLEPLIYYAENYLQKIKDEYVTIENRDIEEKIEAYEAQGYKVDFQDSYRKEYEKAYLRLSKRTLHKVSLKEAKRFSEWLGQENDPVELLERLQHIGFELDSPRVSWQCNKVKQFIASPGAVKVFRKLDAAGIKSGSDYFGVLLGDEKDVFLEFIQDERAQELFTPETIKRIKNFEQYVGEEVKVGNRIPFEILVETFSRKDELELLNFIAHQGHQYFDKSPESMLRRMTLLKTAGVSSELAALVHKSPWIARRAYEYALSDIWSEGKIKQNFESVASSETTLKLLADEKLSHLVFTLTECAGIKENEITNEALSTLVGEVEKLKDNPHVLILLGLAREWGLPLGNKRFDWQAWTPQLEYFSYLVTRDDVMEVLVKPEFSEFVKRLHNVFGYELSWSALVNIYDNSYAAPGEYRPRWLLDAFQDTDFRKRLDDEDFKETTKYFDRLIKFSEDQNFYRSLSRVPHAVQMVEKLEERFSYTLKKEDRFRFIEIGASYNSRRREELFTDETINFYRQLHEGSGYTFSLDNVETLCRLAKSEGANALVSNPEARPAIEAVLPFGIDTLWNLQELDPASYPLVPVMVQEFSLQPNYDLFHVTIPYITEHQEVALPALRELKQRGFDVAMTWRDELERLPFLQEHKDLIFSAADQLKQYGFPIEKRAMSMLPVLKRLDETHLASAIEKKSPLLLRDEYRSLLDYVLLEENFALLIQDEDDFVFINSLVGTYSKASAGLIRDYRDCVAVGALSRAEKSLALEFLEHMRVLSPTLIIGYKEAKTSGTQEMYVNQLKTMAEKLTGSAAVSDEERQKPYYADLIRAVYPHNSGNWTTYENNASCEDRTADLEQFKLRPRYEIDLLSVGEVTVKEDQSLDMQAIDKLKENIFSVARKAERVGYDMEKMKAGVMETLEKRLDEAKEKGFLADIGKEQIPLLEERIFLLMTEVMYGDKEFTEEELKPLILEYEFSTFEDIQDYIQGTSDRVSQAKNQDYALLCELNAFYADRVKEVMRRCTETALKNPLLEEKMPHYFKQLQERMATQEATDKLNKLQVDKLGLTEGFIKQIRRTLEQKGGKKYLDDQIRRLIHLYEVMAVSLDEEKEPSEKKRTKAFAGQLKVQRTKTLQAMEAITGEAIDPASIHLGEMNLQELLKADRLIREGKYDEQQFAQYTLQKFLNAFDNEKETIINELDKFVSTSGSQREVINAYIAKSKETANARMVGGVCVSGDSPKKVGEECQWNMPNYFDLVLQDPESYRCLGPALLHYFQEEDGKKILTASFNPSSTYLYSVDEKALFKGMLGALETFALDNNIDMIQVSKNPQIRTNRTGGAFEQAMNEQIARVSKEYSFNGPRQFSYNPKYFSQDSQRYTAMDVIWENPQKEAAQELP